MEMNYAGKVIKDVDYLDSRGYLQKALIILKTVKNLRLLGETGTGKTILTHAISESLNSKLFECVLTRDTSRWDLLATDTLAKGETLIRKGIITAWLESDEGILYLDGFNYAEPNIVSLTESLADFRGSIHIPELNQTFKRSEKHYLVISYNPAEKSGYSGTFIENIATIRRFEGMLIDYMSLLDETKYLMKFFDNRTWCRKFVDLANKTRILYKEGKLRTPLTTGNLINYAKLKQNGMDDADLIEIASTLFAEAERDTFKRFFGTA